MERIPTKCVALVPLAGSAVILEKGLRGYEVPVISRISKEKVLLDPRTIQEDELDIINKALLFAASKLKECK